MGTSSGTHYVLHSFNYNVVARLEGQTISFLQQEPEYNQCLLIIIGPQGLNAEGQDVGISCEETSWSPDGRYVICGGSGYDVVATIPEYATCPA